MTKFDKYKMMIVVAMLQSPAFAGLDKVEGLMKQFEDALRAISLTVVTVAFMWVGYKVLFAGSSLREMGTTIVGAVIIAAAAEIAKMLI